MKIKWIVAPAPTGPYKSFRNRGWPSAFSPDGNSAMFAISCSDEYVPKKVKNGWHKPLKLQFADRTGKASGFNWRTLNYEFLTLDELKKTAQMFADKNPHLFMNEGQET